MTVINFTASSSLADSEQYLKKRDPVLALLPITV